MVQKLSYTANSITLGTGTSRVILGADSGNLIVKDSDANTSIVEPGSGIIGGSAVTTYANPAALPFSPISSAGSLAYTTSTGALYMSNGSGWYKVTLVNTAPSITLSSTTAIPTATNLTIDFTYTVTEPEGTPVNVTLANSGIATTDDVAITHTTSNNHVRLVFDGTTEYTDATVTLTVTDGVNTGTGTITITSAYYAKLNSRYNSLLLKTKTNDTLTTVQKSIDLDSDNDYLTLPNSDVALGTGDFTIETFVYLESRIRAYPAIFANINNFTTGALSLFAGHGSSTTTNFQIGHNGTFPAINAGTPNYNQWDHLAVVRDSGTITLYHNGISLGSFSSTAQLDGVGSTFYIGTTGDSIAQGCIDGQISNFRIVVGTAVYTGEFTPPTGPLTKTGGTYASTTNVNTSITASHTKLLTAQGTTTDNSDNNVSVATAGTPTVSNNSPFQSGNNDLFVDGSSSSHVIRKNGDVPQGSYSPFRNNEYSMYFDGNGDYLTISDSNDFNFATGNGDFTIESWIYKTNTSESAWYTQRDDANNELMIFLDHNISGYSAGQVSIEYDSAQYTFDAGIRRNTWHHIALVRTGTTVKWFTDGEEKDSRTEPASLANYAHTVYIGTWRSLSRYFQGYIKDFRIVNGTAVYTTAFTPPEELLTAVTNTKLLIGSGNSIRDASASAHTVTRYGQTFVEAFSPYDRNEAYISSHGGSVYFDGTSGNWLSVSDSDDLNVGTGDFTLECWIKPESGGAGGYGGIFGSYAYSANMVQLQMSNTGTLRFVNPSSITAAGSTDMRDGQWHHIAMCRSGTTLRGFVDGVQEISTSYSSSIDWGHNTNGAVIGILDRTTYPTNYLYKGYLSNLRLVKGTAVYTSAFTPPTSPLTAITNTKLLLNFGDAKIFDASQSSKYLTLYGTTKASSLEQHFSENTIALDSDSDYIELSEPAIPLLSERDYTVDFWFYSKDTNRKDFVNQYTVGTSGRMALFSESGRIKFFQNNLGTELTGPTTWTTNAWHHVVLQNTHEYRHIYLNGVHQGYKYGAGDDMQNINTKIGAVNSSGTISNFLNGYMHDVRITKDLARYPYYSKPVTLTTTNSGMTKPDGTTVTVTASNVTLLTCHAGTAGSQTITDGSTNNTTITVYGNAVVSDFGPAPGMKSVYFDGTGDYLQCTLADTLGTNDWTLEYWVYHNNLDDNDIHCAFNGYAPAFYYRSTSTAFAYYSGGHNTNIENPEPRRWYHMVYSHDASENKMRVFVDGTFIEEPTYNGNINGTTFRIGDDGTSAWMDGYISNLRIVKDTVLYTNSFTPVTNAYE